MQPARFSRPYHLAAIVVVAGSVVAFAGCSSVGDRLTGVEVSRAVPTTCIQRCNDLYRNLFDEESKRHLSNLEVCRQQPVDARSSCFDAESLRHSAEMERLSIGLSDCQRSCARDPQG